MNNTKTTGSRRRGNGLLASLNNPSQRIPALPKHRGDSKSQRPDKGSVAVATDQKGEIALLESLPHPLFMLDASGGVGWCNDSFCDLLGRTAHQVINKPIGSVLGPHQAASLRQLRWSCVQDEKGELVLSISDSVNRDCWVRVKYFSTATKLGCYSAEDVTAQQLQANRLKEVLKTQKKQQDFIANVGHEMRNMVNVISGMSHLLEEEAELAAQRPYLRQIKQAADFLSGLTESMLCISNAQHLGAKPQSAPFDLNELLQGLSQVMDFQLRNSKVSFSCRLSQELTQYYEGDKTMLYQILLNLLNNAIKFTENGEVQLSVDTHRNPSTAKGELSFKIRDTGIGIAKDQLNHVFGRFQRASNGLHQAPGTGLGLAIIQDLTARLGGQIDVESKLGQGSCFTVRLPMQQISAPASPLCPAQDYTCAQAMRVLIVEDDPLGKAYLAKVLDKAGASHHACSYPAQAMALLEQYEFDLALIDLNLQGESGCELTEHIRNVFGYDLPIIGLSGDTKAALRKRALSVGMNAFLAKPFRPDHIYQLLAYYGQEAEEVSQTTTEASTFRFSTALDQAELQNLYEGELEQIMIMFEIFLRTTPESVMQMERALAQQDWERLAQEAHKISPTFAMVGLRPICAQAKALEAAFDAQHSYQAVQQQLAGFKETVADALELLSHEYERLQVFLKYHKPKAHAHDTLCDCR